MCLQCPAGMFNPASGATACLECEPGKFLLPAAKQCQDCSPGHFTPDPGMNKCLECRILGDTYQPVAGNSACLLCPARTQLMRSTSLTAITDCICELGSWRPDGARGAPCLDCPRGAYCNHGLSPQNKSLLAPPYPLGDVAHPVWAKHQIVYGTNGTEEKILEGYPWDGKITEESRNGKIKKLWTLGDGRELAHIFHDCRYCLGRFECEEGRAGKLCSQCAEDFSLMMGTCRRCNKNARDYLEVRAQVRARVHACVRACVHVHACLYVRAQARVHAWAFACSRAYVCAYARVHAL